MNSQLLQIPRQLDSTVIKCFKEVADKYKIEQISINVIGDPQIGAIQLNDENEVIDKLLEENSAILETLSMNIQGLGIQYHRGGTININGQQKPKSPYYDEVVFHVGQTIELSHKERIELTSFIASKLSAYTPKRGIGETPEQQQLSAIHNATLERLEELNESLIKSTQEYRKQLDEEYAQKVSQINQEYTSKKEGLENKFKIEEEALNKKQADLDHLRSELDDKDNTHARRILRKDILKEIKNRQKEFKLTSGTIELRTPISIAMIFLVIAFGAASAITTYELFTVNVNTEQFIFTVIKQTLFVFGTVGSVIFYIRWLNRWFEQHSTAEFQLKQFELDMERASWLVETSLEWKDAKGTTMPPELMKSLSSNLFNEQPEIEQAIHPADQLASALLGTAKNIKLKTGDSSIEIDPNKLKNQGKN